MRYRWFIAAAVLAALTWFCYEAWQLKKLEENCTALARKQCEYEGKVVTSQNSVVACDYRSHYNRRWKRCFVLIADTQRGKGKTYVHTEELSDQTGNEDAGMWISTIGSRNPSVCKMPSRIYDVLAGSVDCTGTEWNNYLEAIMETKDDDPHAH